MNFLSFLSQKVSFKLGWGSQKGFSLVELMVVVAIIGILASIAIPNYQRFQRKAKQGGAKIELSGMYTAQKAFITEWGYGTSCKSQHGYASDGKSIYNVGWAPASTAGSFNASSNPGGYNGPPCPSSGARYASLEDASNGGTLTTVRSGTKQYIEISNSHADFQTTYVPTCSVTSPNSSTCPTGCTFTTGTPNTCTGTANAVTSSGLTIPGGTGNSLNNITFIIGAIGDIGGSEADAWIITDQKLVSNSNSGL